MVDRPLWLLGSAAIATAAVFMQHRVEAFRNVGGIIGTLVSALFLFGIAFANLLVLRSIYTAFTRVRKGAPYVEENRDRLSPDAVFWHGCSGPRSG